MKKKIIAIAALAITGTLLCQNVVLADGVEEKPYLSLGADLNKKEKATVLELLGVEEDELDEYTVVTVTNKDEHEYLDDYLSASVIGTRALSSVLVEKTDKGDGIDVTTKNITYCTEGMYQNALTTAGIEDADVVVAGPFNITGTAALVGAMNAYEDMTGETISEESKDAATNELVVTSELAEELNDSEKAEQFLALIKEEVLSADIKDQEDINEVIGNCEQKMQIELTEEQRQQIAELMEKINGLDLDLDVLKQQASDIYDELSKLNINTEGFFAKVQAALSRILDYLSNLF
ncbi:MAG: DUF1002 domain-containing protein [Anaerobutyricum sp.]|nr:DUF1002 domain-containing protein [Eubacterium sp.]MDY6046345.1 DUF1002 domain-containing protein [Anaerobutyricum sp.]